MIGCYPTCIRAGCILNATEVPLHADTYAVVLLRQLKSCAWVIVEGLYLSRHTGEVLKTALFSWKDSCVTCFVQEGKELWRKSDISHAKLTCNRGILIADRERMVICHEALVVGLNTALVLYNREKIHTV